MAAKKGVPNMSAFIREVLTGNNDASMDDVNSAWSGAGNRSTLNPALYYQMRSKLGLGGKRKKKKKKKKARSRAEVSAGGEATDSKQTYLKIEQQLDGLIHEAGELKDGRLAEALRDARRKASAKLL
jgi:hypothetical protein